MILLNPWALLGLLAIGVVILLHSRRQRKTLYVSNLHLWQAADEELNRRRPVLERFRKNRQLILQILFVILIILALARPSLLFWNKSHTVVLVFDCSISMNARERGATRMELARAKAYKILNDLSGADRVIIVQDKPRPVLNFYSGSDKRSWRRALESLTATETSSDISQALIIGLSSIGKTESYEAFVFSDGTQNFSLPRNNDRIHYILTGESDNNVAISRLSVRSNPFSPYDREIYAEATNYSNHAQEFRFNLSLEGTPLIGESVKIASKERKSFTMQAPPGGSGIVKAVIDVKDDLDEDNRATATLDLKKISVLLVSGGNKYLENALTVNLKIALTMMKPDEFSRSELRKQDVIILDGVARTNAKNANLLIIEPVGNAAVMGKGLVSYRPDHPVLSFINLGNIIVEEAFPLKIQPSETVLIEWKGKPLLAASENGAFRIVRMGFDIRSSNMPLTISFPVLVSNIVNWLGSRADDSIHVFHEQESDIKPRYKPVNADAFNSIKPAATHTGREIWRLLLIIALALLFLQWSMDEKRYGLRGLHRFFKVFKSV
jgi:Ca-activated chloride channel homolog